MEKLRHFSLFSGIEAFKKAMTNVGIENELVGYSEIDKYASAALAAIHGVDESLNYGDITKIDEKEVPDCDLITYGFPCQDISIAGHQKGIVERETRSGLLYDALRIIKYKKPKYAIAENVKNLVGKKFKGDFNRLLEELDGYGFNNYWQVLNAKDYGIPQNRERVFIVSIRKDVDDGKFEFPKGFDSGLRLKDFLEDEVDEKFYISQEKTEKLISQIKQNNPDIQRHPGEADGVYTNQSLSFTRPPLKDLSRTLKANVHDAAIVMPIGVNVSKQATVLDKETDLEEQSPNELKLFTNLSGGKWDKIHESARRVYHEEGIAQTIPTCGGGNIEPKVLTNYKIRKLTPKECWKLMGFTDEDYHKARQALEDRFYNGRDRSNSQMYKMAGNSIVVEVLEGIFKQMLRRTKYD